MTQRPLHPETIYRRSRPSPERLNNSVRRTYDLLRSTLQNGEGSVSLVESELTDALSASRNTVRAVLQHLARDGFVTRRPKRGTRPEPQLVLDITNLSPTREFGTGPGIGDRTAGNGLELQMLEVRTLGCPAMVRERLELPEDWSVLMVESLLVQDELALGLLVSYLALPPDHVFDSTIDEPDPLLFLEQHLGVRIVGGRTTLGAASAGEQTAELVGIPEGSPMIFLEDVLVDDNGRAWALSQFRMRSDRVVFQAAARRSAS